LWQMFDANRPTHGYICVKTHEKRQNYVCFYVTQLSAGALRRTSAIVDPPPLQYIVVRYAGDARSCRDFQVTCSHFFVRCYKKTGNWNSFAVFREILQVKPHKGPLRLASLSAYVRADMCGRRTKFNKRFVGLRTRPVKVYSVDR
jgi:hypothetical protein